MQDRQDEFYRTLCSSETLRSSKRGFFQDFSESVMRIAGDSWTSRIFGRIDDDAGRVRTVLADAKVRDVVMDTLAKVKPLFRDKDAEISKRRRLEGYQLAAVGQYDRALLLFSQAVLRAPQPDNSKTVDQGMSLPLALLGRAEIFMALKEYHFALEDLRLAAEYDLPDKSAQELQRKIEECERFLKANEKSLMTVDPVNIDKVARLILNGQKDGGGGPLNGAVNSEARSWSSSALEIRETSVAGKHAVATTEIHPGDILIVEPPLAGCLLPEFYGTHCQHCYARLKAPIGCPNCSCVAFCGRKCRDIAMATYHKYECKILALLIGSGMSVLSMVAFRMVTQEGLQKCLRIYGELKKSGSERAGTSSTTFTSATATATTTTIPDTCDAKSSANSRSAKRRIRRRKLQESRRGEGKIQTGRKEGEDTKESHESYDDVNMAAYNLVTHADKRTEKDFLERSLMAVFLLRCLQRVGFFAHPTSDDEVPGAEEIIVAALLLRNLQLLQFNAHEFFETRLSAEHRFRGSRPVYLGVAIYPTVARFNHDCYPAVTRYFVGRHIVIRAVRGLQPGDIIAENYGPIFTKMTLAKRQRTLAGRYWFRCTCRACQEDWPHFENLTNDSVRLRCPTAGCNGLHSRAQQRPAKPIKCPGCKKRICLEDRLACLQECETLYARGLASMDNERVNEAIETLCDALKRFHRIACPPHRDTHLAEIALSSCLIDYGNTWRPAVL
ncbi:SET and MYND domain-containing protein 4 isoform X1 [Anoplolepis gracilipes]|uniref:SET and MYND domain-containing protein 4 isoform X1 n=2 Tax=Anoplolepis gracilipes TaxID=354296 RepID=UPI003B9F2177